MKTPKRTSDSVLLNPKEWHFDPPHYAGDMLARWKRKNRVKQLKRSLEKYKYGTHLSGDVGAAYRRLQSLVRPGKNATIAKWANYLNELRRIQEHITCAIANTAILLAYDAERKEKHRKEQA